MTLNKTEQKMIEDINDRLSNIERKVQKIQNIVIGIAIGIAISAVILGMLSIQDFVKLFK